MKTRKLTSNSRVLCFSVGSAETGVGLVLTYEGTNQVNCGALEKAPHQCHNVCFEQREWAHAYPSRFPWVLHTPDLLLPK